jgi:hypothetical protein
VFFRGSFRTAQHPTCGCRLLADPGVVPEQQGCNRVNGWQTERFPFAGVKQLRRHRRDLLARRRSCMVQTLNTEIADCRLLIAVINQQSEITNQHFQRRNIDG